ncbi:MAG: acyl-CoA desaturase [Bacteroidia bacterium]
MKDTQAFTFDHSTSFDAELRREVKAYFQRKGISTKANKWVFKKAILLLTITIALYIIILNTNPHSGWIFSLIVLLGFCISGIGFNIAHEVLHGTMPGKRLGRYCGYTMDLLGLSSYLWKINHGAHHSYTNVHGLDGDIKESALLRLSPYAAFRPLHRYQLLSAFIIYGLFYFLLIYYFNTLNLMGRNFRNGEKMKLNKRKVMEAVGFKVAYLLVWIVIPLYVMPISIGEFLLGYFLLVTVTGFSLTLVFFVAHEVEVTSFSIAPSSDTVSWAEHQLRTTVNFKAGRFLESFLGGLNYQIEHHLFPNISSAYYPALSPIVKRIAEKHGIQYKVFSSFGDALKSHIRLLRVLSADPGRNNFSTAGSGAAGTA